MDNFGNYIPVAPSGQCGSFQAGNIDECRLEETGLRRGSHAEESTMKMDACSWRSWVETRRSPIATMCPPIRTLLRDHTLLDSLVREGTMNSASSKKAYKGLGMEGVTAKWYASLTRKSMNEFVALAGRVAETLSPGSQLLEIAPGPGYFAIELAKLGGCRITAIDISQTFVEIARRNAMAAGVDVDFRRGDAANMPFEPESFDFLLCRAAFKNFTRPVRALEEMYRVLKPGGHALIIDLRKDASKESVNAAVDRMQLGRLNTLITKLTFRYMLLKRAYTRSEFEQLLSQTRFDSTDIREDSMGLELSLHRHAARSSEVLLAHQKPRA
jgi:ubiquinone/menaquinone biosynthesis C-methylase UbiE